MGQLKPGAKYIYERVDCVTYAREFGAESSERFVIGYDWSGEERVRGRSMRDSLMEDKLWGNIRRAAEDNPALKDALDKAIEIYHLTKENK